MIENNFESNLTNTINNILLSAKNILNICNAHLAYLNQDQDLKKTNFSSAPSKRFISNHYLFTSNLGDLVRETDEYISKGSQTIDMSYSEAYDNYLKKYTSVFETYIIFREKIEIFFEETERSIRSEELSVQKAQKLLSELIYRIKAFCALLEAHL